MDGPEIAQAFIVADKDVELNIKNPDTLVCVHCLMAIYYVCDIIYPRSYTNFLRLFDFEVMGQPKPKVLPTTYCNFI